MKEVLLHRKFQPADAPDHADLDVEFGGATTVYGNDDCDAAVRRLASLPVLEGRDRANVASVIA